MCKPASPTPRQIVDSILEYLARYEQYAVKVGSRHMIWHFEECWQLVFTAFYGGYSLPRLPMQPVSIDHGTAVPAAKPPWYVMKYSRPARKVVAQVTEGQHVSKGHMQAGAIYDVLTCGHKMPAAYKEDGSMVSKWRYCNACPPKPGASAGTGQLDSRAA